MPVRGATKIPSPPRLSSGGGSNFMRNFMQAKKFALDEEIFRTQMMRSKVLFDLDFKQQELEFDALSYELGQLKLSETDRKRQRELGLRKGEADVKRSEIEGKRSALTLQLSKEFDRATAVSAQEQDRADIEFRNTLIDDRRLQITNAKADQTMQTQAHQMAMVTTFFDQMLDPKMTPSMRKSFAKKSSSFMMQLGVDTSDIPTELPHEQLKEFVVDRYAYTIDHGTPAEKAAAFQELSIAYGMKTRMPVAKTNRAIEKENLARAATGLKPLPVPPPTADLMIEAVERGFEEELKGLRRTPTTPTTPALSVPKKLPVGVSRGFVEDVERLYMLNPASLVGLDEKSLTKEGRELSDAEVDYISGMLSRPQESYKETQEKMKAVRSVDRESEKALATSRLGLKKEFRGIQSKFIKRRQRGNAPLSNLISQLFPKGEVLSDDEMRSKYRDWRDSWLFGPKGLERTVIPDIERVLFDKKILKRGDVHW